jgi:hypothetical protein
MIPTGFLGPVGVLFPKKAAEFLCPNFNNENYVHSLSFITHQNQWENYFVKFLNGNIVLFIINMLCAIKTLLLTRKPIHASFLEISRNLPILPGKFLY